MAKLPVHKCLDYLQRTQPDHMQAVDGEKWTCICGRVFEHFCTEAQGCFWEPLEVKTLKKQKENT